MSARNETKSRPHPCRVEFAVCCRCGERSELKHLQYDSTITPDWGWRQIQRDEQVVVVCGACEVVYDEFIGAFWGSMQYAFKKPSTF